MEWCLQHLWPFPVFWEARSQSYGCCHFCAHVWAIWMTAPVPLACKCLTNVNEFMLLKTKMHSAPWTGRRLNDRQAEPCQKSPGEQRGWQRSKSSSSISHGTTFLFAIYQLPKAHEYIVNTFISPCQFCEKQRHLVYKLNTRREGTVKTLSLHKHRVNQSHSSLLLARRCLTQCLVWPALGWNSAKASVSSSVVGTRQCVVEEACEKRQADLWTSRLNASSARILLTLTTLTLTQYFDDQFILSC